MTHYELPEDTSRPLSGAIFLLLLTLGLFGLLAYILVAKPGMGNADWRAMSIPNHPSNPWTAHEPGVTQQPQTARSMGSELHFAFTPQAMAAERAWPERPSLPSTGPGVQPPGR